MTRSQFRHAVQWIAELDFGRKVRRSGHEERSAFNQALGTRLD